MTTQGDRQASVRASTGTALDYNGDWHALFDAAGIAAGDFNGRMLAWINSGLGTTYPDLNGAKAAYAASQGADTWDSMGTFTPGGGGTAITGIVGTGTVALSAVGSGSGETQTITPELPTDAQAGDLLLACLSTSAAPSTVATGWDLVASKDRFGNAGACVYSRIMVDGDTAPTFATVSGLARSGWPSSGPEAMST